MPRCPTCDYEIEPGCNCAVADGTDLEWTGDGSDGSPFALSPILSADPDNLLTCGANGMLAEIPDAIVNPPACQIYKSTHTSVPDDTLTALSFNARLYDTDTMHSLVTDPERITIKTAGVYVVTLEAVWNKNVAGDRIAQVRKNGSDVLSLESKRTGGADLLVGHSITVQDVFAVNDYLEALVHQTSGGNLLLLADSYSPVFSASRVA